MIPSFLGEKRERTAEEQLQSWCEIGDILSKPTVPTDDNKQTQFKPASADPSLLLPSTFSTAVNKRHNAKLQSLKQQRKKRSQLSRQSETQLTSHKVVQAIHALKHLRKHYENLISNFTKVREALIGFDEDSVIWVPPESRKDFVSFITALNTRWGSSTTHVADLVEWAMNPKIDNDLLGANVDTSARAYESIEQAFHVFRLAFDDMLKLHADSTIDENESDD